MRQNKHTIENLEIRAFKVEFLKTETLVTKVLLREYFCFMFSHIANVEKQTFIIH